MYGSFCYICEALIRTRRCCCYRRWQKELTGALQRARATMQSHLPARRAEWSAREPSAGERKLLEQFNDRDNRTPIGVSYDGEPLRGFGPAFSRIRRVSCQHLEPIAP